MNPPSESKKSNLGPTGETVRQNVIRLRGATQYKQLSEWLTEVGRPIHPVGLKRIEAGERRVDADDLMALSVIFGVAPNALLLPHVDDGDAVRITGTTTDLAFDHAWEWADGEQSLNPFSRESRVAYELRSRPITPKMAAMDPQDAYKFALGSDAFKILRKAELGEPIYESDLEYTRQLFDEWLAEADAKKRDDGND